MAKLGLPHFESIVMADAALEFRLRRRMRELAIELLGSLTSEAADELRFGNKGGLWVGLLRGVWIDFSADRRPRGPLELIQRVHDCGCRGGRAMGAPVARGSQRSRPGATRRGHRG